MPMRSPVKRISIMIGEEQYEKITEMGLNISGFIRELIDDHFSEHKITLSVSKKTHDLYNRIVANTGASDKDIEPFLHEVLKNVLDMQMEKIKDLKRKLD